MINDDKKSTGTSGLTGSTSGSMTGSGSVNDTGSATNMGKGSTMNSGSQRAGIAIDSGNDRIEKNNAFGVANESGSINDFDVDEEDRYWSENYSSRPYSKNVGDFDTIRPAYQYGASIFQENEGRSFDEINESSLRTNWEKEYKTKSAASQEDDSTLSWENVKEAVRDAYDRLFDRHQSDEHGKNNQRHVLKREEA